MKSLLSSHYISGGDFMGKKHRNRINEQKKNNHVPENIISAEQEAHHKEQDATKRKNSPGHNL